MKGSKRTLGLLLVLLLVVGAGGYFLFFKKKKKPQKPKPKPPLAELMPSPTPEVPPPPPPPPGVPGAPPGPSPQPVLPPGTPPGMPGGPPPPMPPVPPGFPPGMMPPSGTPPPGIPHAESLPTETQPTLELKLGDPIKTAEGTMLALNQAELAYGGKARVKFLWEVIKGPPESIKIMDPQALKTRVSIENLDNPVEFTLKLTASDGKTEVAGELQVTAFPAKLSLVTRAGGAWTGISHMGDNWVAVRGNEAAIFNPNFEEIARAISPWTVRNFLSTKNPDGKGAIFVQSPEGNWAVLQSDPALGTKVSQLPMLGKGIRRVFPFIIENSPYAFALLDRGVELWNLGDPTHPRLKTSIGQAFLQNPLYLSFLGRNLYVADEERIHLIDFQGGNLVASVPAGGSITSLNAINFEDKNYLVAAIGRDRTPQGRKDYGLRVFEIQEDGRLGTEKRLSLQGDPPIRQAFAVPGSGKVLLGAEGEKGLELRMAGLKPLEEIGLEGTADLSFLSFNAIETGKIQGEPVAVIADGNQLRVLAFKQLGEKKMAVSAKQAVPGIISAGWVEAKPDGSQVWVGDEGTTAGGGLAVFQGSDLKALLSRNAPPATYPVSGAINTGSEEVPILLIGEDLQKVSQGQQKEGALGLVNTKDPLTWNLEASAPVLGQVLPQGLLRPFAVAGRAMEGVLRIGVAVSRLKGNIGGAGLMFWDKPAGPGFLQTDLPKTAQLVSLGDARDVVFAKEGKGAFLAAGVDGVIALDLEKKAPIARMSLGSKDWYADRVVLGAGGNLLLVSFLQPSTAQVILKIFSVSPDLRMQELGTVPGLKAVGTVEGLRAPLPALTEDDLYLFLPSPGHLRRMQVLNLSNPSQPVPMAEVETPGEIRGISVANRFRDIFVAVGPAGVAKYSFGF